MPPKAKAGKQDKSSKDKSAKQEKTKGSTDDPKKLKAANAVKVRHILCEKQSKGILLKLLF